MPAAAPFPAVKAEVDLLSSQGSHVSPSSTLHPAGATLAATSSADVAPHAESATDMAVPKGCPESFHLGSSSAMSAPKSEPSSDCERHDERSQSSETEAEEGDGATSNSNSGPRCAAVQQALRLEKEQAFRERLQKMARPRPKGKTDRARASLAAADGTKYIKGTCREKGREAAVESSQRTRPRSTTEMQKSAADANLKTNSKATRGSEAGKRVKAKLEAAAAETDQDEEDANTLGSMLGVLRRKQHHVQRW